MDLVELARRIVGPHESVAACRQGLADIFQARAVLDSFELALVNGLQIYSIDEGGADALFAEQVIAEATRSDLSDAARLKARGATIDEIDELGEELAAGTTTGDHVDAVTAAMRGLRPEDRRKVGEIGAQLAQAAATQTKRQFRTTARRLVATADDGTDRLTEQKRQTRLRFGVAADTGMWWLRGQLDPETGARMEALIRRGVEQLFAARTPDHCPDDALDKQHFLHAHTLVQLLTPNSADTANAQSASGGGGERVDVSVLIDWKTLLDGTHEGTISKIGLSEFGLPPATISRWACCADITPVVVAPDGQRIMLGRTVRLANRAQRRALRALYRTCALCDTPFEHTEAHHVSWYTLGGMTDITNLVPLCSRHHHLVHEGGWHLAIATDRTLTLTAPDQTQTWIPPPKIAA